MRRKGSREKSQRQQLVNRNHQSQRREESWQKTNYCWPPSPAHHDAVPRDERAVFLALLAGGAREGPQERHERCDEEQKTKKSRQEKDGLSSCCPLLRIAAGRSRCYWRCLAARTVVRADELSRRQPDGGRRLDQADLVRGQVQNEGRLLAAVDVQDDASLRAGRRQNCGWGRRRAPGRQTGAVMW